MDVSILSAFVIRWRFRAAGLLAMLLGVSFVPHSSLWAQAWPRADGLDVGIYVGLHAQRALTSSLRESLQAAIQRSMADYLGKQAVLQNAATAAADEWLTTHHQSELNASLCENWGWGKHSKTIVVSVEMNGSVYSLQVGEYDHVFYSVHWLPAVQTQQREMLPMLAARLAREAWLPIGEVQQVQQDQAQIYYPPLANPETALPAVNTVLQMVGQLRLRNGIKPTICRDQFLVVTNSDPHSATGLEVSATLQRLPRFSSWLARHGDPRIRYLVRRILPPDEPPQVEVRIWSTGQPRAGCEAFISPQPPVSNRKPGTSLGLTNSEGRVSLAGASAGLNYVTVFYNDLADTQIYVPGAFAGPLVFKMPSPEERLDFKLKLAHIRQEIEHRRRQLSRLADELTQARVARDLEAARRVHDQVQPFLLMDDLRFEVEKLRVWLLSGSGDPSGLVVKEADQLLAQISALEQQDETTTQADFSKGLQDTRVAHLNERFAEARDDHDWKLAGSLLQELTDALPDDAEAQRLAAAYRSASVPRSPAHAQARVVIQQAQPQTISELQTQWPTLQPALVTLIANEDRMAMDAVEPQLDFWNDLLDSEIRRIEAVASVSLPQAEAAALTAQKDLVLQIVTDLDTVNQQRTKLLQPGVFPASP